MAVYQPTDRAPAQQPPRPPVNIPYPLPEPSRNVQPDLLTAQMVAARLSVSVRTIWRLVERNELPQPIRWNRKLVRWSRVTIEDWVEQQAEMSMF